MTAEEEDDWRYLRPGFVETGTNSDKLVRYAAEKLPGGTLPQRWAWKSQDSFLDRFGDLGKYIWAKTASYHMLMVGGRHAFRIWNDCPQTALVDVDVALVPDLADVYDVMEIPPSTYKKTKPMTKRIRIESTKDVDLLIAVTLKAFQEHYGI